jgi:hypothetical protein
MAKQDENKEQQKEEDVQNPSEVNLNNVAVEERNKLQDKAENPDKIDESQVEKKVEEIAQKRKDSQKEDKKEISHQQWRKIVDDRLREERNRNK